jgi:hypothetical protein
MAARHALAAGLVLGDEADAEELIEPVRAWLASDFFGERIAVGGGAIRAEAPLLLSLAGTILRGSIDLLVEREGVAPLVVDYKTDRLIDATPAEHAERYAVQRDIYALAVAEAREAPKVEVAYVFLERPEEPAIATLGEVEMEAGRKRLAVKIERIRAAESGDIELGGGVELGRQLV